MADTAAFRRARMRMAFAVGVRLTLIVGVVVAMLGFLLVFSVGSFSAKLMSGKLPVPPAPVTAAALFGFVALLGLPLTVASTLGARRAPGSRHAEKANKQVPVLRWADHPRARIDGDVL